MCVANDLFTNYKTSTAGGGAKECPLCVHFASRTFSNPLEFCVDPPRSSCLTEANMVALLLAASNVVGLLVSPSPASVSRSASHTTPRSTQLQMGVVRQKGCSNREPPCLSGVPVS